MRRLTALALLALVYTFGCSGDSSAADEAAKLKKQMAECETQVDEGKKYIDELNKRLAELEVGGGDAVVVHVEGDALTVTGAHGPNERVAGVKGHADDVALYEAFMAASQKSRPAIKKCYQGELKNNQTLQAHPVTLEITVDYKASGTVKGASFQPSISSTFSRCMKNVAQNWDLPASPKPVTFTRKLTLTPG
ncbi:MAG TPA: hypothetical protein VFG83_13150 [Kofleriaceae bacterium]|nr:hypothetical protein [Kofleriaceae bacterium]